MRALHGGDIYTNPGVTLDFSVNVNPLGMPEFVREAARLSVGSCAHYPDSGCGRLRELIAAAEGVKQETVLFGNGAAELIFDIVRALRPERAVLPAPCFLEYARALKSVGTQISYFYLKEEDGFVLPVPSFLRFLEKEKPRMIFLCNPSNPVGTVLRRGELEEILDFCADRDIFAVVDECFLDFLEQPREVSSMDAVRAGNRGLFAVKALTKSFAAAGLRLGYGFLNDGALRDRILAARQPWNVSVPAQAAGEAVFENPERAAAFLEKTRELLREEKPRLAAALRAAGCTVFSSGANYLFFKDDSGRRKESLFDLFLERGVLIRSCGGYEGLDGRFYRICVGNHEENERFLEILGNIYKKK